MNEECLNLSLHRGTLSLEYHGRNCSRHHTVQLNRPKENNIQQRQLKKEEFWIIQKFVAITWKLVCNKVLKEEYPKNTHICLILQANCQHTKWSFNVIFFLSWCFTFSQCLVRVSAFYKKLLNIKKCYCSMFIKS